MKLIKRSYLEKMIRVIGTPDIKVITGVRRCGKSELLEQFSKYVKKSDAKANVIFINYSLDKFNAIRTSESLIEYVNGKYDKTKHNFLLIDEVQMCKEFERAINNFHAEKKYDIYITGSNAFLLSSDLATLFTGRTFEIEVYPFSYNEFLRYYGLANTDESFDRYAKEGGMPGAYAYTEMEDKYKYVEDVFNTLIVRDLKERYGIKDELLVEKVTDFMVNNVSNLTSILNISNTLNSNHIAVTDKTVGNYVSYLCMAFLFYRMSRYDIVGKKYLTSSNKYYLCDPIFKYAVHGTKNLDYGRMYENMVAIELMRRGYEVYVGVLYENEVDFVAVKRDEKIYIQVADSIDYPETFEREVKPLLKIRDAFPKIVVARTQHDTYQYEGVQVVDIAEFLNKEL